MEEIQRTHEEILTRDYDTALLITTTTNVRKDDYIKKKEYQYGLDIIRLLGMFFVLIIISVIIYILPQAYKKFGWNFWVNNYPIAFYFIGCFIREYQPKIKKIYTLVWIMIIEILEPLIQKYSSEITINSNKSLGSALVSVLIFLLFYDLKANNTNCFFENL